LFFVNSFIFSSSFFSCPQPQTSEHLAAVEIMKLQHLIVLQNKVDLISQQQSVQQYGQIKEFVQGIYFFFTFLK